MDVCFNVRNSNLARKSENMFCHDEDNFAQHSLDYEAPEKGENVTNDYVHQMKKVVQEAHFQWSYR